MGSLSPALVAFAKKLADPKGASAADSLAGGLSSDTLSSYLDAFDKELADLAAAMEAVMATKPTDSSTSHTVNHGGEDKVPGFVRSRIFFSCWSVGFNVFQLFLYKKKNDFYEHRGMCSP